MLVEKGKSVVMKRTAFCFLRSMMIPLFVLSTRWVSCEERIDIFARLDGHVSYLTEQFKINKPNFLVFPTFIVNEYTQELIEKLHEDVGSLAEFWKVHQKEILDNEYFCRQFTYVLVVLYQNLVSARFGNLRGIPWLSLAALYFRLNAIPLGRLFDVLDECFSYYQAIINDYSSPKDTLSSWMMEHWWLPVFIVGMGLFSFVRWYRSHLTSQKKKDKESDNILEKISTEGNLTYKRRYGIF